MIVKTESATTPGSALLDVLMRRPASRRPMWFMRQAGRYLPEYRAVREKAGSFLDLCYHPELASEVTLQPLRRYDLDAAILFADILVVPHAMGLSLRFAEGEGPILHCEQVRPVQGKAPNPSCRQLPTHAVKLTTSVSTFEGYHLAAAAYEIPVTRS